MDTAWLLLLHTQRLSLVGEVGIEAHSRCQSKRQVGSCSHIHQYHLSSKSRSRSSTKAYYSKPRHVQIVGAPRPITSVPIKPAVAVAVIRLLRVWSCECRHASAWDAVCTQSCSSQASKHHKCLSTAVARIDNLWQDHS